MNSTQTTETQGVHIELKDATLLGHLNVPAEAQGLVLFAHGSGSGRNSPRNRAVAEKFNHDYRLATLLFDLLSPEEAKTDLHTGDKRFDIALLSSRLKNTITWCGKEFEIARLPIGIYGSSTGAAAALRTAAEKPDRVSAVLSRGGRPDLASAYLPQVAAPVRFVVGEKDEPVIAVNRKAMQQLNAECDLQIVPGASHLFEEPGTLSQAARLAGEWFEKQLPGKH